MPWRLYGPALILAVPLGVGLGAVMASTLTWTGWGSLGAFAVGGAVLGGATAVFGAAGALIAVQRSRGRGERSRIPTAAAGAAVGAAAVWALLLAYFAVVSGPSVLLVLAPLLVAGTLACALAAGLCAMLMAGCHALEQGRRRPTPAP